MGQRYSLSLFPKWILRVVFNFLFIFFFFFWLWASLFEDKYICFVATEQTIYSYYRQLGFFTHGFGLKTFLIKRFFYCLKPFSRNSLTPGKGALWLTESLYRNECKDSRNSLHTYVGEIKRGWKFRGGAKTSPEEMGNVGSAVKQHANNRLLKVINSLRGNEQCRLSYIFTFECSCRVHFCEEDGRRRSKI